MRKRTTEAAENALAGSLEEVCARYAIGAYTAKKIGAEAGAIVRVGRLVRFYYPKMDKFFEDHANAGVKEV